MNKLFQAALAAEKEVQPVGEDYVEEERNSAGKLVQYNCKLCECKFSDPNAKNIHIKGRKHRLQYKVELHTFLASANTELFLEVLFRGTFKLLSRSISLFFAYDVRSFSTRLIGYMRSHVYRMNFSLK